MKATKHLQKIVRGFSNHRRIEIMALLDKSPALSVIEIADELNINFKTASEHTRRLENSGLVLKYNHGSAVRHALTPLGKDVLMFLRTLEQGEIFKH